MYISIKNRLTKQKLFIWLGKWDQQTLNKSDEGKKKDKIKHGTERKRPNIGTIVM